MSQSFLGGQEFDSSELASGLFATLVQPNASQPLSFGDAEGSQGFSKFVDPSPPIGSVGSFLGTAADQNTTSLQPTINTSMSFMNLGGSLPLSRGNSFNENFLFGTSSLGSNSFLRENDLNLNPIKNEDAMEIAQEPPFSIPEKEEKTEAVLKEVAPPSPSRRSARRAGQPPLKRARRDPFFEYDEDGGEDDETKVAEKPKKGKEKEKEKEKETSVTKKGKEKANPAAFVAIAEPSFKTHLSSPSKLPRSNSKRLSYREQANQDAENYPAKMGSVIEPMSELEVLLTNNARATVDNIDHNITSELDTALSKLHEVQQSYLSSRDAKLLKPLQSMHDTLMATIEDASVKLQNATKMAALEYTLCFRIHQLLHRLNEQMIQVQLYKEELQHFSAHGSARTVARLIIAQQPARHVIFKEKYAEDIFVIKLLTGTQSRFDHISDVTVALYFEEEGMQTLQEEGKPLDYKPASMGGFPRTATFNQIKMNSSSRMLLASLKFMITLKLGKETQTIESSLSNQFIVITNESQFVDATQKLLMTELYGDVWSDAKEMEKVSVKWPSLSNLLQLHFISATSQRDTKATRALQYYELNYLHRKYAGGVGELKLAQVMAVMHFVLNSERLIRFKRHVFSMWNDGCLFGFFSREKVEDILSQHGLGTFIVRVSESHAGNFVISFVADEANAVSHYMIKSEDVGSNRSLPDFLRDVDRFQYILAFSCATGDVVRKPKGDALAPWTTKKKAQGFEGYVDTLF